jgi:hypothetical protein
MIMDGHASSTGPVCGLSYTPKGTLGRVWLDGYIMTYEYVFHSMLQDLIASFICELAMIDKRLMTDMREYPTP